MFTGHAPAYSLSRIFPRVWLPTWSHKLWPFLSLLLDLVLLSYSQGFFQNYHLPWLPKIVWCWKVPQWAKAQVLQCRNVCVVRGWQAWLHLFWNLQNKPKTMETISFQSRRCWAISQVECKISQRTSVGTNTEQQPIWSQNHTIFQVGRDPQRSWNPTPGPA